ncbi:uncharacterized protein SPPG_09058 [Spizellomyces punctatus DAOM BR117]|uniref:Uncharacterized protein n=1 Tax=Spizellomyces punctatus (strain DAOM BR117) TaxID=645134 RepID=A0A0L0HMD8_SPIPD|nr:uncharacterized protein SPPG_09058 [Spizellomyces punctatus DAOM BR117]KND02272.1 hypothetical protein SPPG_09058 [Spizellomyces punctatus DAOM BR117]|eukprot:XP_016610311.1 hypothetical protein SPPG_09058 [Spizellomyces punctatus DAOM BR117]
MSGSDEEIDFDVEEVIRSELKALSNLTSTEEDDEHVSDEETNGTTSPTIQDDSDDSELPTLERMESWADYIQTIESREADRREYDNNFTEDELPPADLEEYLMGSSRSSLELPLDTPIATIDLQPHLPADIDDIDTDTPAMVAENIDYSEWKADTDSYLKDVDSVSDNIENGTMDTHLDQAELDRHLEEVESELNQRLSILQTKSASEEALLESLHKEAEKAGIPLDPPLRRELVEETLGLTATRSLAEGLPERNGSNRSLLDIQQEVLASQRAASPQAYHTTEILPIMALVETPAVTDVESEEEKLLRATERNLRAEYDFITGRQREEAGEQSKLRFRLDSFSTSKTTHSRAIREFKQRQRDVQEKTRRLVAWFANDAKVAFDKERDRAAVLMGRLNPLLESQQSLQRSAEDKLTNKKQTAEKLASDIAKLREEARPLIEKATASSSDIESKNEEIERQTNQLQQKKAQRDALLLKRLEEEEAARKRELDLLLGSLKRQRQSSEASAAELLELESLELKETSLTKIPNLEAAPKIRHVILDNNMLSDVRGLEGLKDLRSLSLQGNHYTTLDLGWFTELRSLNAANNDLSEISHISACAHLHVLDLSHNPLKSLEFLSSAKSMHVLVLRNTQLVELGHLEALRQLLYLDVSQNRLHNPTLESISDCKLLQYLSLSENVYTEFPRIPNNMLCELDVHHNNIRNLNIAKWSPRLRIINLSDNHVKYIEPLAMAPFLQELNLANNYLADFTSIFGLAVCRDLKSIDLTDNPIVHDANFHKVIAVLFPRIKSINGRTIEDLAKAKGQKRFAKYTSVKVVKWCKAACKYLRTFIEDEHQSTGEKAQCLQDFRRVVQAQHRNIATFMGAQYKPYLRYLYAPSSLSETEEMRIVLQLQERRINWLAALLQQHVSEIESLLKRQEPNFDMALMACVEELSDRIKDASIATIQALWRGRMVRRAKLRRNGAARLIQKCWRQYKLRKLENVNIQLAHARQQAAAVLIQATWRGHKIYEWYKKEKRKSSAKALVSKAGISKPPHQVPTPRPVARPHSPDDLDDLETDVHKWLDNANENEFDEKMDSYLQTENLVHFSQPVKPPIQRRVSKQYGAAVHKDAEAVLRQQFETLLNSNDAPPIGPRDPLHMLLVSRGMVKTPSPGRTAFGDAREMSIRRTPSPEGRDPTGMTASMLLSRRSQADRLHQSVPDQPEHEAEKQPEDIGAEGEKTAWNLSSEVTQALLQRKIGRDAKMQKQAKLRERLKDPMERLKTIQALQHASALKHGGEATRNGVIYEWDVLTAKDLRPDYLQRREPKRLPPLDHHFENPAQTNLGKTPGPVLLINNYVSKKLMRNHRDKESPEPQIHAVTPHLADPDIGHHTATYHVDAGPHSHRQLHYAFYHAEYLPSLKDHGYTGPTLTTRQQQLIDRKA